MLDISIVCPVHNEVEMLPRFIEALSSLLSTSNIKWELIFVDDGSTDDTWTIISRISQSTTNIRGIKLSRNFGKDAAILAGLRNVDSHSAIVIDGDLQHPPALILEMVEIWQKKKYLVIECINISGANKNFLHNLGSNIYYFVFKLLSGFSIRGSTDFKLIDRVVIDYVIKLNEYRFFFKGAIAWAGFKSYQLSFVPDHRIMGTSKWRPQKLMTYAFYTATSFSTRLLLLIWFFSIIFLSFGLILGIRIIASFISGTYLPGILTIYVIELFSGGFILLSLSLIATYLDRIFHQSKARPIYLISHKTPS